MPFSKLRPVFIAGAGCIPIARHVPGESLERMASKSFENALIDVCFIVILEHNFAEQARTKKGYN